ncbi:sensor histidine kinase [Cohnella zeiphila]|uniref:histidine kinase n=1 Tax=Cohnella zeiphila TaxID=2761120 RepID=A0A7X0VXM7_9BACL|nr:ATP-binding protein [Cohnella zeiphila]MBB6734439.1 sensor histidine kinase [Cohnella zeiphila]
MFGNIRTRLAFLNAAVLLLVLSLLSSVLYVHMRHRLFHETDEVLKLSMPRIESFHNLSELIRGRDQDPQQDEKTTYLFWDSNGSLIGQSPDRSIDEETAAQLRGPAADQVIRNATAGGKRYRAVTFPNANSRLEADSITVIRSLRDVDETLRSLLLDLAGGIVAGAAISILAGLFLAERALVPIRRSWEKQQRFVADASHELRTPTSIIQARTELLLHYPERSIEQESPHIAVILQENKRMGKLIADLLTLARSDSNQIQIQASEVALDSLIVEVADQFRFLAENKSVEIETNVQRPLTFRGDEARLRQLLVILLDNAFKYTPFSGRIEITGESRSHSVYLSVADTGCGIPKEDLPHVFERFYRGDKARSRAQGGTGLGLSIAKWIVEAHHGTIRIRSEVGLGTKAEVSLPRAHERQYPALAGRFAGRRNRRRR